MLSENKHTYTFRHIARQLHPLWAAATARANSCLVPSAHLCRLLLQSPAHQCRNLDSLPALFVLRSVLKQKTRKALKRAQEDWSLRMKISLRTNFSNESLHYSTNYFHFTCSLIYPGQVSSDTDDSSPDLALMFHTAVKGAGKRQGLINYSVRLLGQ